MVIIMIIDAHVHIGDMMNFSLKLSKIKEIMENRKIEKAVVSSIDATEVDHYQKVIEDNVKTQTQVNQELLELLRDEPDFSILVWCKPLTEGWNKEFENFLLENLDKIKGLKFHPFHSAIKMTDKKIKPYLEFANKYKLAVKVHCADDKHSKSKYTYKVAKKYPNINFVMAHLELGGNHKKARELLLKQKNLYADTAWLPSEEAVKIILEGGQNKIIFGSDAPIDGDTHYKFYEDYFSYDFIKKIGLDNYTLLMNGNAIRVYKLKD